MEELYHINLKGNKMKIQSIKKVGKKPVYDLSVEEVQHYVLKNGVVTHNTGVMYSSDNIWIIGRQQDKDDEGLQGYHFIINVEKSRYVKEKSKIPITVNFDSGINKWSGLLELALEGKFIAKPKPGWYTRVNQETGELDTKNYRAADIINNGEFWKTIFNETKFKAWIQEKYSTGLIEMLGDNDV
jgi:hypothetical protein